MDGWIQMARILVDFGGFGMDFGGFWWTSMDFGGFRWIVGGFLVDLLMDFGWLLVDFGWIWGGFWVIWWSLVDLGWILDGNWVDLGVDFDGF